MMEAEVKRTRSSLVSRNVTCSGRRTSVRLEPEIWDALHEICYRERLTAHELCTAVDLRRNGYSLTAALRVFVVTYYRQAATGVLIAACADPGISPRQSRTEATSGPPPGRRR